MLTSIALLLAAQTNPNLEFCSSSTLTVNATPEQRARYYESKRRYDECMARRRAARGQTTPPPSPKGTAVER